MKINRLVTALTISLTSIPAAHAARYQIVELPVQDKGVHTFSSVISNSGEVGASATSLFNPPIDVSLLDFDDETLVNSLTDPDGVQQGNINDEDLLILYNRIESNESNQFYQQIGDTQSFLTEQNNVEDIVGFDVFSDELNGLTRSINTVVTGITSSSVIVGSSQAPYYKVDYQNEAGTDLTYVVHDYINRGYVQIGDQVYPLMPPETTLGGISEALGINDSLQVAGQGSVDATDGMKENEENCRDDDVRSDIPVESCIQSLFNIGIASALTSRALIWQLDDAGNTLSTTELGILLTPNTDDERIFESRALAINNNGIAVGASDDYYRESTDVREFAAIFDGDEVIGVTNHDDYFNSIATDINDSNVAIGYAFRNINGFSRSKFFYHDMNTGETVYPDDFFNSSSSTARAINNSGIIVGEGDVESTSSSSRRKEAFMYDIAADEFTNINDLLTCDTPYTIVQGNDINDNNEIAATAEIYRQRRNIAGELEVDDNGDPIMQNMAVAVKLIPIPGGEVEDCSAVEEVFERKGASFGWLLLPLSFVLFRRLKKA